MAMASSLFGAGTTAWEMTSYQDFIRGRFQGLSLTRDGRLTLAPKIDTLFTSDQPIVWNLAQGRDGMVYAATGHRGKLYQIDKAGQSKLIWTADQPEIFALTVDAAGALYAGTSPDGKVYRIVQGKATEYFAPGARYIWSLAAAPDGALYVGTGDQGKIFRVTAAGKGEVYYETGTVSRLEPGASIAKDACWPAASPTESCIASPRRTRPSSCTIRICRRYGPS